MTRVKRQEFVNQIGDISLQLLHPVHLFQWKRAINQLRPSNTATGIDAIRIEDPKTCGSQFDGAIHDSKAVLIEAVVDEFTPPMPAKIKASQALKLSEALLRGEPNRMKIVLINAHDKVRDLI